MNKKGSNISEDEEDIEDRITRYVNPNQTYFKIKYRDSFYSIGDFIIIIDKVFKKYIHGKLIEIIPRGGTTKYPFWPSIKIEK